MDNYQKRLEEIINATEEGTTLLLHSCCAPCSSYCLEYLSSHFAITIYYYNPNITEEKEYRKRVEEIQRLIRVLNEKQETKYKIAFLEGAYEPQKFLEAVKGYEDCQEGGDRCRICFALRLENAAKVCREGGFDFFTTTLTISPLKNAELLNDIGKQCGLTHEVKFLPSDFKKKNGYKRSIELSREYDLYRQDYCGCAFSKAERIRQKENKLVDNNAL